MRKLVTVLLGEGEEGRREGGREGEKERIERNRQGSMCTSKMISETVWFNQTNKALQMFNS